MNSSLKDKLFPPIDDLHAAIRFDSDTGTIWMEQQRMLLLHASALGSMRQELIESLGKSYARGVLVRMGWASAQSDAEMAKRLRADRDTMDIFSNKLRQQPPAYRNRMGHIALRSQTKRTPTKRYD